MQVHRTRRRALKSNRTYDVYELSQLLEVHKNTIRDWRRNGLEPIDDGRPALFAGEAVKAFLQRREKSRKRPCPPGTFFCLRCRTPKPPALGMVDIAPFNELTGNAKGLCADCETVMHRSVRLEKIEQIFPKCALQIVEAYPRLTQHSAPSLNPYLKPEDDTQ